MTNKLVKVDRVGSADEAVVLEKLGVDLLGVDLASDPRFDDGRGIPVEQAAEIDRVLTRATLVPRLDLADDPARILRAAQLIHARLVQPARRAVPPAIVLAALSEADIGIVYGGIEIAHDDDPGWVFSDFTAEQQLGASFFQADVLPEYQGSWAFLRDRSPEFEDEFQVADLDGLAAEYPLFVGLNFTRGNVREILDALPHIRGLVLTLADRTCRDGVRHHSYRDALDTLQALRE